MFQYIYEVVQKRQNNLNENILKLSLKLNIVLFADETGGNEGNL
jgi:hypothetical protein